MHGHGGTSQEIGFMEFLRDENIGFVQQKVWRGYGDKKWITDFYLPQSDIVIECKDYARMNKYKNKRTIPHFYHVLQSAYKDLWKLDELGELYNLTKVFFTEVDSKQVFPVTFIANMTVHRIFLITEKTQILPIIQGVDILKHNTQRYQEQKMEVLPNLFEPKKGSLEYTRKSFTEEKIQILWDWSHGKTLKELGLHPMRIHRLLRKFVKMQLEPLSAKEGNSKTLMEFEKHGEAKL